MFAEAAPSNPRGRFFVKINVTRNKEEFLAASSETKHTTRQKKKKKKRAINEHKEMSNRGSYRNLRLSD